MKTVSQIKKQYMLLGMLCLSLMCFTSSCHTSPQEPYQSDDEMFALPYIDIDEWRDTPIRHRYVHGGFEGTDTRFSFYMPTEDTYKGRFFQYITPIPDNENISQGATGEEDKISFSVSHGAYFVETNGGGQGNTDPLVGAYKANAAVAKYSRYVAVGMYGNHQTYGYAFGGSGGAYRTIGGMESTDAWDGAVPYVVGSPMAIPNVFAVRMNAMRILDSKFPQIIDAVEPGGSGDMYAGLTKEEAEALLEVTKMGFPPQSWFGYKTMGVHGFNALYPGVVAADRSYFDNDFWNVKGYLGADKTSSIHKARLQFTGKIKAVLGEQEAVKLNLMEPYTENQRGTAEAAWKGTGATEGTMPVAFQMDRLISDVNFQGGDIIIKTGDAAGKTLQASMTKDNMVAFSSRDLNTLAAIKVGDEIQIDNSNFLAAQMYHRHQVPDKEYKVWDQFRDENGDPIYPQRPMILGPLFTQGAAGVIPTGKFNGKMIVLCALWDREAFPWQGDWYFSQIKKHLGNETDNNARLWYIDRALHGDLTAQEDDTRTVSYVGALQQALLDLSDWVERGITPPATNGYTIEDGQVVQANNAAERKGIQPIVSLTTNGQKRVDITAGDIVTLTANIQVPPNSGEVVSVEWNFEGDRYTNGKVGTSVTESHQFTQPGTYFATVRVTTQRQGNTTIPFTRIANIDRVRVVVK